MNNYLKLINFDGYKFRQAMKSSSSNTNFYGEDWELHRTTRLEEASNDCQRMWRHLWQKMATALKSR
jgi:hypothetical protein